MRIIMLGIQSITLMLLLVPAVNAIEVIEASPETALKPAAGSESQSDSSSRVLNVPETSSAAVVSDGPKVELITGGNSTDGATRVGALPILD